MTANQKKLLEELKEEEKKRDLIEYNDLKKKVKTFGMYTKKEMQKMKTRLEFLKRKYNLEGTSEKKNSNLKELKKETIRIQRSKNKKEHTLDKNISRDAKLIDKETKRIDAELLWYEIVEVQRKLNNAKNTIEKEKLEIHKNMLIDELKTKRKNKEIDDSFFTELKEKYNKQATYKKIKNNIKEIDTRINNYETSLKQAKKDKNKNKIRSIRLNIKSSKKSKKSLEKIKKAYIDTKALLRKNKANVEEYTKKEISGLKLKFNAWKNKTKIKKVSRYLNPEMLKEIKYNVQKEFNQPKGPIKINKKIFAGGALAAVMFIATGLGINTIKTINDGVDDYKKPDYPDAFSKFMDTLDTKFLQEEKDKKENIVTIRVENSNSTYNNDKNVKLEKEEKPKPITEPKNLVNDIKNNQELVERIINADEEEFNRIIEEYYGSQNTKGL